LQRNFRAGTHAAGRAVMGRFSDIAGCSAPIAAALTYRRDGSISSALPMTVSASPLERAATPPQRGAGFLHQDPQRRRE